MPMNHSRSLRRLRPVLLIALLPFGCLLVRQGPNETIAASPPTPTAPIICPPLPSDPVPTDTLSVPTSGGRFNLSSGTALTIPEDAFIDAQGQPVSDPVELTVREFQNPVETWLGGIPMTAGDSAVFRSAGMMEVRGSTPDGTEVELAAGKSIRFDWYSADADPGYVTWALDTATGTWSETGTANNMETRDLDAELQEAEAALPPRVNPVVPTRFGFDIGDLTGGQPELDRYKGVRFEPVDGRPCGHDATRIEVDPITDGSGGAFLVRFIVDTVVQMEFLAGSNSKLTYTAPYPIDTVTECRCNVALPPGVGEREAARIQRLLNGESDRKRERGRRQAMALWQEYNEAVERQFLADVLRPSGLPNRPDQPGRVFQRSMEVDRLGWVNCDIIIPYPDEVDLLVDLIGPDGAPLEVTHLAVLELDTRTLYPCEGGRIRLNPNRRNAVFGYTGGQLAYLTKAQTDGLRNSLLPVPITPSLIEFQDMTNPTSTITQLILGS